MLTLKQNLPFDVPNALIEFVSRHVNRDGIHVINFRDKSYHPSDGGFRPVEIMIEKLGEHAAIHYYTEFRYVGVGSYAELCKSNDFDFTHNMYYTEVQGDIPISADLGELFQLFVSNTLSYFEIGFLDEMTCSFVGGHLMLHKNA